MKKSLGKSFFILWKDVISEFRTRDVITSVLVFALLVIVIFNFTFEPGTEQKELVAPGILWVAFTFAGVLSLGRSFVLEKEKGCFEGLLLCPVGRDFIYMGKMFSSLTFMLIVEAIVFPIFLMLFNLPLFMPKLGLIALLATVGFVSVGTLFSAIAANTRAREIMLPVLFFPVVSPVIIAAVKASGLVLEGGLWDDISSWLLILATFDFIFLIVSALVFGFVVDE